MTQNKKSRIVTIRLPLDVIDILKKRIDKGRWTGLSDFLRDRITYDTRRKHHKAKSGKISTGIPAQGDTDKGLMYSHRCDTPVKERKER